MNTTSRAVLQSVLSSDGSLTEGEKGVVQQLIDGRLPVEGTVARTPNTRLLVSQKEAATMLDVSRVTIWRMGKECLLHPVEILPGTWRYQLTEIERIAALGWKMESAEKETQTIRSGISQKTTV